MKESEQKLRINILQSHLRREKVVEHEGWGITHNKCPNGEIGGTYSISTIQTRRIFERERELSGYFEALSFDPESMISGRNIV